MGNLRIKVKFRGFEIELEGEKDIVLEEFNKIKESGVGNLTDKVAQAESIINMSEGKLLEDHNTQDGPSSRISEDFPHLNDVVMLERCKSEKEWILIYAFYKSNFGSSFFTKKDILTSYEETSRKKDSHMKNFSNNFKAVVKDDYINSVNNNEYRITSDGAKEARKLE